ncbi:CorA family divalent cation transporter [Sideroxydans lithotrophicus]|uniref:Mg2 transporter protein CorA family protein n=1 Tax=Sideroxydans lithotrophicus (strain ES-1) TaxID=580332 RepID=D5CMA7_SIDLE|nr:CorA family divalent cation transporter [Sideroxydans lithotrophicus]ADE10721.1 Mg2 transporter protein CorA family protein [Sideroxydans lithotrophicus ES-1]
MSNEPSLQFQNHRQAVLTLLEKRRVTEEMVKKQDIPHHDLVETLVRKQNLARIQQLLSEMPPVEIAALLEVLPEADQLFIWDQVEERRKEQVLPDVSVSILNALGKRAFKNDRARIKAFELFEGRLREILINTQEDLTNAKPIWIDLVDPSFEERAWVGDAYDIELPDPDRASDLETSARFYMEENGEIHLRSDFLLDKEDISHNVGVSFTLHQDILFSVRKEELPVFRLQRLRALSQPNYVSDARDVLLDLYAADVEYSADALEDIYQGLERVGSHVLSKQMTDEEAAKMLADIGQEEDLNGRIRRNVLDTRRAVSFLMRSRVIERHQLDDAQQILRDIESMDGHTTFLFGKINFLMDATVGFININQNKVIKRLTVLSVVFMPLNVIAGIGGMSEFSMMTQGIPWPISYTAFTIGMVFVAWITYELLRLAEKREKLRMTKS